MKCFAISKLSRFGVPKIRGTFCPRKWEVEIIVIHRHKRRFRNHCETFRPFVPKHPVFDEGDCEEFCNDTWLIILNSFPSVGDSSRHQCWPLPQLINRDYVVDKARVLLGFSPRFNFNELISSTSIPASEFGQRRVDIFPISMGAQNSFATSRSYSPFSGGCAKNP